MWLDRLFHRAQARDALPTQPSLLLTQAVERQERVGEALRKAIENLEHALTERDKRHERSPG